MGNILDRVEIFEGLSQDELDMIAAKLSWQDVPEKTLIIREGEPASSLYVIERGRLVVFCSDSNGHQYFLNTLSSSDYFGELALIDGTVRSSSVRTETECRIGRIHKEAFHDILAKHPTIAQKLLVNLAQRIRALTSDIKNLTFNDVYFRVVQLLTSLSEERGDGTLIVPTVLSKQDIADRVGVSRETVVSILATLNVRDYLRFEDGHIIINSHLPLSREFIGEAAQLTPAGSPGL